MTIQKLRGIWIPKEILLNEELADKEKIILAIILYLSEETQSCFISNRNISNIVNVTQERVSKIVSSLKNKGYIEVKLNYKLQTKEIENRQISPIREKINSCCEKDTYPNNKNNDLSSYKQQTPIVRKDKEIINNNKKYKNNYKNTKQEKNDYYRYKSDRNFDNFNWDSLLANKSS